MPSIGLIIVAFVALSSVFYVLFWDPKTRLKKEILAVLSDQAKYHTTGAAGLDAEQIAKKIGIRRARPDWEQESSDARKLASKLRQPDPDRVNQALHDLFRAGKIRRGFYGRYALRHDEGALQPAE